MKNFLAYFSVLVFIICHVDCIMFHLHPNTYKCLKEDMAPNQLVVGEYEVQTIPGQTVDYVVSSSFSPAWSIQFLRFVAFQAKDVKGHILAQKEHITKGKFSFTSEVHDTYEICFISKVPPRKYFYY